MRVSETIRTIITILFIIGIVIWLTNCTTVRYSGADGSTLTVTRVQPLGDDIGLSATVNDVGTLEINKSSGSAQETAQAVIDGLLREAQ